MTGAIQPPPWTASLPMYVLPGMAAANAALWDALRQALRARGLTGLAETLDLSESVPPAIGPETLFTQICGYPLLRQYRGQGVILAVPHYGFPGCDGPWHRAAFMVRAADPASTLAELRGRVFGCNSIHSNTGMNLPRLALAQLAQGAPFFQGVTWTGSHLHSLRLLQDGRIDLCSVDCVTWGFVQRHLPALAAGCRVLDWTQPSPCLPFVTAAAVHAETQATLRSALADLFATPSPSLQALRLTGLSALQEQDYAILAGYEADAARLGYPVLA